MPEMKYEHSIALGDIQCTVCSEVCPEIPEWKLELMSGPLTQQFYVLPEDIVRLADFLRGCLEDEEQGELLNTGLPGESGHYWYRRSDQHKWQVVLVHFNGRRGMCLPPGERTWNFIENYEGQWVRVHPPE